MSAAQIYSRLGAKGATKTGGSDKENFLVMLGANGKIPVSMIPAVALTEIIPVANEAARLTLTALEIGTIVKQADNRKSYILFEQNGSDPNDWIILGDADDTADAIIFDPAGNIEADNVQDAIEELDAEKADAVHSHVLNDLTDASAVGKSIAAFATPPADRFVKILSSGAGQQRTANELKSDLTLNNVDNTNDASKPISILTQQALDAKRDRVWTLFWNESVSLDAHPTKDVFAVNSSGGPVTMTLPTNPNGGRFIRFTDLYNTWETNPVTMNRNGQLINGDAANLVLDVSGVVDLIFVTGLGWRVFFQPAAPAIASSALTVQSSLVALKALSSTPRLDQAVFVNDSGTVRIYMYVAGDAAEASPGVLRPDDYADTTNEINLIQVF